MDDGAGGRGQDRDRARQKRKLALALLRKRALDLETALELLESRSQLADVVELDLVSDETDGSVLGPVVDATTEDEHLAVLGKGRHAAGVVRVDERVDQALAVPDHEAVVAFGALLHATDLALEEQGGERTQLAPDLVGELGNCVGPLS